MQRARTKATTCHTKAEEPRAGCRHREGRRQEEAKQPQPAASLTSELWAAGVAAAASKGAVVWRVRKGKRAVKSSFACTAVKGSAKAAAMGEAAAVLAKGLQAPKTKICTSQQLSKPQLLGPPWRKQRCSDQGFGLGQRAALLARE